ncbi:MAG: MarR family winged helix-turn-helix transcriptional regulator [Pseudomonadota bacterium]
MSKPKQPPLDAAHQFLELYYPIHYRAGIGVEDALRGNELTRHQTAILWLIHSQGVEGRYMRRKDIVSALSDWFEISNAAITKALRGMSVAPLALVNQTEDPNSGREKIVTLTQQGEAHMVEMINRGTAYVQRIVDGLSDSQIVSGIDFFERISAIVDGWAVDHSNHKKR